MKKRFSEEQIIGFVREAEAGLPVKELCRRHGFSEASYSLWRRTSGGSTDMDRRSGLGGIGRRSPPGAPPGTQSCRGGAARCRADSQPPGPSPSGLGSSSGANRSACPSPVSGPPSIRVVVTGPGAGRLRGGGSSAVAASAARMSS